MGVGKKDLPSAEFIALATSKKERSIKLKKLKGKKVDGDFTSTNQGVVLLKNIPEGFEEKQIKGYFSQFGKITRLKLIRSKKNGKPLGQGYVEFQHEEVAKIVSDTMNNYLMFECCLKCEVVPPERLPKNIFKPSRFIYRPFDRTDLWERMNKPLTAEQVEARKEKHKKSLELLRSNMKELGIEYNWGDLKAKPWFVPPQRKRLLSLEQKTARLKPKENSIRDQLEKYIEEFDFCENERGVWALNKWTNPSKRKRKH